jgi:hypothetical protein
MTKKIAGPKVDRFYERIRLDLKTEIDGIVMLESAKGHSLETRWKIWDQFSREMREDLRKKCPEASEESLDAILEGMMRAFAERGIV